MLIIINSAKNYPMDTKTGESLMRMEYLYLKVVPHKMFVGDKG